MTGRDLVAYDGTAPFLSIHDWFIGGTAVNAGVPKAVQELSVTFRYNDIESVEQMFAAGLVDEVHGLLETHGTLSRTALQAVGYREVIEFLREQGSGDREQGTGNANLSVSLSPRRLVSPSPPRPLAHTSRALPCPARLDITPYLAPRNELTIDVLLPATASGAPPLAHSHHADDAAHHQHHHENLGREHA